MFASFKNKIKEETGHDVSKLPPVVNTNQSKLGSRGRLSHEGSTSSLRSFSIDGTKEDLSTLTSNIKLADGKVLTQKEFKKLETKEDEWRKKLEKKEEELNRIHKKAEEDLRRQMEEKEKEWRKSLEKREKEKAELEKVKVELTVQNEKLKEDIKMAEEYKKKVCQYQEDIDQLEGFQTQELAKIKHLLLFKEQESLDKDKALKDALQQIENMKLEMIHLRRMEQDYEDAKDNLESLRHRLDMEKTELTCRLNEKDERVRYLNDRVAVLEERTKAEFIALGAQLNPDERVQALLGERTLLERRLEESHLQLSEIKSSCYGKISSLENQLERVSRQACEESNERRKAEGEVGYLNEKIVTLEEEVNQLKTKLSSKEAKIDRMKCEMNEITEAIQNNKTKHDEEIQDLNKNITIVTEEKSELETKLVHFENRQELEKELLENLETERKKYQELEKVVERLRHDYKVETECCSEMRKRLEEEKREKDVIMMRNAQVSQDVEFAKQEVREQNVEMNELHSRINSLEELIADKDKELQKYHSDKNQLETRLYNLKELEKEKERLVCVENELRSNITQLEDQLTDKNKAIKVLQSRLSDMKKTLQRELKVSNCNMIDHGGGVSGSNDDMLTTYSPSTSSGSNTTAILTPSSMQQFNIHHPPASTGQPSVKTSEDDVNFLYLKHVLIKFLTSREYEAQHLTRAVATLLRFSSDEEKLLKETLEWKMSWFGSRPHLGNGQFSKTIPPS